MNILILHAHDMGRYNSAYGHATPTPVLKRFAREGLIFRDAHCAAPTCSPSRAAMLTGRTAHEAGMLGLTHRGFNFNDPSRHLARILADNGYHTARAGLQHEYAEATPDPIYDEVFPDLPEMNRDLSTAQQAASFLHNAPESPWYLWVGLFYPHREFLPHDPERDNPDTLTVPAPLPDTPRIRKDMADYHGTVALTDRAIGEVLAALDASGQRDNTLVVITTDHGVSFPDMKCNLTAHGTGVTFLLRGPDIPTGRACDALCSHLDLLPTLLDMTGLAIPGDLHGHSLRPLFADPTTEIREDTFAEVNVHACFEPMRMVRTKTASYIRLFDDDLRRPLGNVDPGGAKDEWVEAGWADRPREAVQLYDLRFDPQERRNLAHDPAYATLRGQMERRLAAWMKKTNDPLLAGPLEFPKGVKITSREALSP
ncbi:MAG: sulfatase [Verrucomicrobia bacterium]|nr:sulfatase [Verrucomicrobiota bacterium]MCH8510999.1 sulfatase [Kiritimatiellia bacterium]